LFSRNAIQFAMFVVVLFAVSLLEQLNFWSGYANIRFRIPSIHSLAHPAPYLCIYISSV